MTAWLSDLASRFTALPAHGLGGLVILLLYIIQSEIRFGSRARTHRAGSSDRHSTWALSLAALVPVLGFALALRAHPPSPAAWLPHWFRAATIPGVPFVAWLGVVLGVLGLGIRLAAVLTLRERYTRTLLVQEQHSIERGGPYRWVRHPGYLGSLLCLNGIALASGNLIVFLASLVVTSAAYAYRVRAEDEMLMATFGAPYVLYRSQVPALFPFRRMPRPQEPCRTVSPMAFVAALAQVREHWSPRVIGRINDQYIKVAKVKGELAWHKHEREDEMFFILYGHLRLQFEGYEIQLHPGEFCVVPKNTMHNPIAEDECGLVLIEPVTTLHTGNQKTPLTKSIDQQLDGQVL